MGVKLPAEYQEVEYLNSGENGAYIDSGFIPNQNTRYLLKARNNAWQFQSRKNNRAGYSDGTEFGFIYTGDSKYSSRFGPARLNNLAGTKFSTDDVVIVDKNKNDLTATNGAMTVHILSTMVSFNATKSILIPGSNTENGPIGRANGIVYQATIWDDDVLVHDFVPCYRKADSEPGMYDLVSGTFFANAGTGEFVVGADVIDSISPWLVARRRSLMKLPRLPAAYREVEWIQGDGSAWIDTGFAPNQDSRIIQKGSNNGWQMTARDAAAGTKRWEVIYTSTGYVRSAFGDATVAEKTSNFSLDAIVTTDKNKRICTVSDGTKTVTLTNDAKTFQCNANYHIGANAYPNIIGNQFKYYYVAIWDNGVLYGEYIPCYRQSDGAVGVYDLVTKTFLPNIGTGAFTTGPKVIN